MCNKIKYLWKNHSVRIIVCGLFGIFTIPWLFTRDWLTSFASYTSSGQIGDTISGTTAPFIGLLSAVLVYRALQVQIEANKIIHEQAKEQREESAERQKHESFMKMYEAYVRVLGDKKLVEGLRTNILFETQTLPELQASQNKPSEFERYSKDLDLGERLRNLTQTNSSSLSFKVEECSGEIDPLMRMAYHLLKKELAQKGTQKWDNIRFFIAQLSEAELVAMAINCLYGAEGRDGLALVARKTGLFQHLKSEGCKKLLQEQTDSEGFFNLEMTEDEYKDKSVKI